MEQKQTCNSGIAISASRKLTNGQTAKLFRDYHLRFTKDHTNDNKYFFFELMEVNTRSLFSKKYNKYIT